MNFGLALEELKKGNKVARKGWNGKGIFIDTTGLKSDNEFAPRDLVPWLASQTAMLAEDWEIVI